MLAYVISFVVACLICSGIMPAVARLAERLGAVDAPGGRRIHRGSIPRLGGIAIFLGFVGGTGAATLMAGRAESFSDPAEVRWWGVALGMLVIFLGGLLDDVRGLSAGRKLLIQVAAAGIAIGSGFTVSLVSLPFGGGSFELGWVGPVAAFAWILLITNAMNLIDGLDGLAGGLALITTTTVASVALAMDRFGVVICALGLAGALIGFLRHNFAPARIFMGDAGSQFLGYVLAVISIRGSQKGATAVAMMVPLLAFGLPILDVATTIVRRMRTPGGTGSTPAVVLRRLGSPDRRHLHHNLLDLGMTPRRAVLAMYLIGALFALSGYLCLARNSLPMAALVLMLSVGSIVVIKLVVLTVETSDWAEPSEGREPR